VNPEIRPAIRLIAIGGAIMAGRLGVGYLPALEPASLPEAVSLLSTDRVPLIVWAIAWLLAAAACLIGAIRASLTWLAGAVGMSLVWAAIWAYAWFATTDITSRDWLTALQYVAWVLVFLGCVLAYARWRRFLADRG
jgi:hypothetical protein